MTEHAHARDRDHRIFCSGTLIAPRYVLSAGHCFDFASAAEFVLGERAVAVEDASPHPSYRRRATPSSDASGLDIALVRLSEPVTDIAPARLGELDSVVERNDLFVRSVGFGLDDSYNIGTQRSAVEWVIRIEPQTFSTRGISGSTAPGDSGGPVYRAARSSAPRLPENTFPYR